MTRFVLPVALTAALISLFLPAAHAQFWSESFNDENLATSNWFHGGSNNGAAIWTWTNDPNAGYQDPELPTFNAPTANDGYFYFDSDNNGQVPHDVWLTGTGNPVDCSGKADVRLRFFSQYIYFNPAGTLAQVGISTDGDNFVYKNLFAGLQANLPYNDWVEVDLDEADNQPQVWLRFRWIGSYEYHWKIDDLELSAPCSEGQIGTFELAHNGALCVGENLLDILSIDSSSFVLPNLGPLRGMAWCFSAAPIPANSWPGAIPGLVSTPFSTDINLPDLLNDASVLAHGLYFLTPVVLGGGNLLNPADPATVSNVNPAGGCYFIGPSKQLALLPELTPLTASATITNEQVPPGGNGAIELLLGGGSGAVINNPAQYQLLWSTGDTIEQTVGSPDISNLKQLELRPNPSTGILQLDLELNTGAALHYVLQNSLGQTLEKFDGGKTQTLHRKLDLSNYPEGIYWLHLAFGTENLQRLILIQR
ncbi:MAG: T9SS type A sorting domain-containing protein [Lewinellaceae bacterium]|nr:T9SS type A sorting domain-containing protein [Lewinellaceae bacterium]